jgi:aminomethyltransferase
MQRTVLYQAHVNLGAKMTEFHDWEMPLYYTSILDEHRAVREAVGLFDISHMGQVIVEGPNAESSLNALLVSDIASVGTGRACYTLMLNERGGIIDDLIVYRIGPQRFLVIVNCSRRAVDVDWLQQHCTVRVSVSDVSATRGILALQGPRSAGLLDNALGSPVSILGRFDAKPLPGLGQDAWVARTGYTGSDGFEVFADNAVITLLWARLCPAVQGAGGAAVGLGARDTLRVEAGLRLYG